VKIDFRDQDSSFKVKIKTLKIGLETFGDKCSSLEYSKPDLRCWQPLGWQCVCVWYWQNINLTVVIVVIIAVTIRPMVQ